MKDDSTKPLSNVIRIDAGEIRGHLTEIVRGTVEETLKALLDGRVGKSGQRRAVFQQPADVVIPGIACGTPASLAASAGQLRLLTVAAGSINSSLKLSFSGATSQRIRYVLSSPFPTYCSASLQNSLPSNMIFITNDFNLID